MKLAIVGAGPAGLVAALAARRAGFETDVYEQAPAFGPVGSGVVLHSNGLRVLQALGLLDLLRPHLRFSQRLLLQEPPDRTIAAIDYRDTALPHNVAAVVMRYTLLDLLADAATRAGARLHLGRRCVGADARGLLRFEDGEARADAVIAADGVKSAVRTALGIPARVRELGIAYLRGIAEIEQADDAFREIWGRDGRQFGICPLPGGRTFFFASAPFRGWPPADLDAWIASWEPFGVAPLLRTVRDWNYDEVKTVEASRWSAPPFHLIGDAAHAMPPNLGQGANSAMVDALVLVRMLEQGRASEYESVRRPFVSRIQRTACRLSRLARWTSGPGRALRRAVVGIASKTESSLRLSAGHHPAEEIWFGA